MGKEFLPHDKKWARDKNGGIGSCNYSHQQGKSKIVNDLAPQEKEGDNHHEGCSRGDTGPAQGLINTLVDNILQPTPTHFLHVFTDTVTYYNGVVNRITDHGKEGRNDRKVNSLVGK